MATAQDTEQWELCEKASIVGHKLATQLKMPAIIEQCTIMTGLARSHVHTKTHEDSFLKLFDIDEY